MCECLNHTIRYFINERITKQKKTTTEKKNL